MIGAFLLPFPFRGHQAPFLWVFYRLLSSYDEPLLFITGKDYLTPPSHHGWQQRWEIQDYSAQRLGYTVPDTRQIELHRYRLLPESLFNRLLQDSHDNPIAALRKLLTENIPYLEEAFAAILNDPECPPLEALLSWCNCPSLSAAAARCGVPVVHIEIGPLRWPHYRDTAYFDFSGVNGNTEAATRYRSLEICIPDLDTRQLQTFFSKADPQDIGLLSPTHDVGVALQVEDDSNLIAFSTGFDNQSLLAYTRLRYPGSIIAVRAHPGSLFILKPDWFSVDASTSSLAFIQSCRRIVTINSSVGLEALLLDTPVSVLGDCAYRYICEPTDRTETLSRLAFFLFAYLVPMDLAFSPDYLRFRLSRPPEPAIVGRHLAGYGTPALGLEGSISKMIESAIT